MRLPVHTMLLQKNCFDPARPPVLLNNNTCEIPFAVTSACNLKKIYFLVTRFIYLIYIINIHLT